MALNEHSMRLDPVQDERHVDLEEDHPFTLIELLTELIQHYSVSQPSPQVASILLLLLGPLLPRTHPLPETTTYQTVATYVDYFLNQLNWNPDDIPSVIRDSFSHPLKAGLQPLQLEHILSTYHDQLLAHRRFDDAAHLRNLAFPAFPALYEDSLKDNSLGLHCGHCRKPFPSSSSRSSRARCEHCHRKPSPCPICWLPRSPFEPALPSSSSPSPSRLDPHDPHDRPAKSPAEDPHLPPRSSLFTACLLCRHTAHAACLHDWFHVAGGSGCPSEGCLCDCVAGAWRTAKTRWVEQRATTVAAAAAVAATRHSTLEKGMPMGVAPITTTTRVRRDEWMARESKAVEFARATLTGREAGM